jgi:hypothetical protein
MTTFIPLILALFFDLFLQQELPPQKGKWTPLFDGKTLKGWHAIPGGSGK